MATERHRIALSRTHTKVHRGEDDLSEWDEEELRRGRRRDKHGGFTGRDPEIIPAKLHRELARRIMDRAEGIVRDSIEDAVTLWREVVNDPDVDMAMRLRASENIVERGLGKPVDRVQVEARVHVAPWQHVLEAALMDGPLTLVGDEEDLPSADVIDVTPESEPDEDDALWEDL